MDVSSSIPSASFLPGGLITLKGPRYPRGEGKKSGIWECIAKVAAFLP